MNYIYCYTNKINGHKYIGQTNDIERRKREHRSCAQNVYSKQYKDLFHSKLRQYGEENFSFTILEVVDNQEAANEAEKKWIEKYHTYSGDGYGGYNLNRGGKVDVTWLYIDKADQIKAAIKAGQSYEQISKDFGISPGHISNINSGKYYYDENETYPLFNYRKNEEIAQAKNLLINSSLNMKEIAEKLNLGYSTVKKLNYGTLRKDPNLTYPLRKANVFTQRAQKIKELLEAGKSNLEIIQETGVSAETIRKINKGITYKDNDRTYPIRNL